MIPLYAFVVGSTKQAMGNDVLYLNGIFIV
jgi:hypothetical protein